MCSTISSEIEFFNLASLWEVHAQYDWTPEAPDNGNDPEGPKIEKIQDFAPGLKFSSDQSQIEIFNRD